MLCAQCGEREVPRRTTGRPRRFCESCRPSKWFAADDVGREASRQGVREHRIRRPGSQRGTRRRRAELAGRLSLMLHLLRLDALAEGADPRTGPCGCGRDYLTVPLEEAHLCIRPVRRDVAA